MEDSAPRIHVLAHLRDTVRNMSEVDASGLDEMLLWIEQCGHLTAADRREMACHAAMRDIARDLLEMSHDGDNHEKGIAVLLWCAFNHPEMGEDFRKNASLLMRRDNRVFLSVCNEANFWSFAIGDSFNVPVGMANLPPGSEVIIAEGEWPKDKPS